MMFLKKNLEGITEEQVEEYSVVLCKIHKKRERKKPIVQGEGVESENRAEAEKCWG